MLRTRLTEAFLALSAMGPLSQHILETFCVQSDVSQIFVVPGSYHITGHVTLDDKYEAYLGPSLGNWMIIEQTTISIAGIWSPIESDDPQLSVASNIVYHSAGESRHSLISSVTRVQPHNRDNE